MEAVGSGTGFTGAGGGDDAGAGRAGRRGRRRVVAPPTSGQSHEVESDFTDPFRADAFPSEDAKGRPGSGSGAGTSAPDPAGAPGKAGADQPVQARDSAESAPPAPLTAHEQWILSQRPPHWG
ncbi:hypothetical protein [Nesterenkonia sp. CF4.4]|uniref:hypothetical protein n=1 Tax=Nesterenkonia sp. CF4.4 TaxID=3373079 RepID=UPI003EE7615B